MSTTIKITTNDGPTSAGDPLVVKGEAVSNLVITNNTGESIQYSTNSGSSFTTLATGSSATLGSGLPDQFRFRRANSGAYPLAIDATFTEIGSLAARFGFSSGNTVLVGADGDKIKLSWFDTRKVILIGDSITAQNWSQVTFNDTTGENEATAVDGYDTNLCGYAEAANALMGSPYTFVNAAKSGATTAWMLTNLALVIGNHPDASEVWIHGGTNDVNSGGFTTAQIVANITAMVDMALAAGMRVVWNTCIMPAVGTWTDTQRNSLIQANAQLKALFSSSAYKNVDIVDASGRLLDTSGTTGRTAVAYMQDTLHPSNYGGLLWGLVLKDTLAYRTRAVFGGVDNPADYKGTDTNSTQLIVDPLHLGATGAAAGTGMSGTQIAALTIGRTSGGASDVAVASVVDSPDGIGKAQKLVITAGTGACAFRVLDSLTTSYFVASGQYRAEYYIKCSALTAFSHVEFEFLGAVTSAIKSNPGLSVLHSGASPDGITYAGEFTLRVVSPILTVPSDTSAVTSFRHNIIINFTGIGGGTFEIYRRAVRRVA